MTALTHFSRSDPATRTAVNGEITQYTVSWTDLSGAGFANGDDVLVLFFLRARGSGTTVSINYQIGVGSTFAGRSTIADSLHIEESNATAASQGHLMAWFERRTLVSNENFYVAGTGTTYSGEGYNWLFIKLSDLTTNDWFYNETSPSGDASTTYTDGASATVPAAGDWMVMGFTHWLEDSTTANANHKLVIDGTDQMVVSWQGENATGERTHYTQGYATLAGGETAKIQYNVNTSTTHDCNKTRIFGLRLGAFADKFGGRSTTTLTHQVLNSWQAYVGAPTSAPTFVQEAESTWSSVGAGTATKTTGTFSVQAGDIVVAMMLADDFGFAGTLSVSGGSLSWTIAQQQGTTNHAVAAIAWAVVDTNKTMDVTVTRSSTASACYLGVNALTFRNALAVGNSTKAEGAAAAPSVSFTSHDKSAVVWCLADWIPVDGASRTYRTGAGAFTEQTYDYVAGSHTFYGGYHADSGSQGTYSLGLSAPSGQTFSFCALEIIGTKTGVTASQTGDVCFIGCSAASINEGTKRNKTRIWVDGAIWPVAGANDVGMSDNGATIVFPVVAFGSASLASGTHDWIVDVAEIADISPNPSNTEHVWAMFSFELAAASGGTVYNVTITDGVMFNDPTTFVGEHTISEGMLLNDPTSKELLKLATIGLMLSDNRSSMRELSYLESMLLADTATFERFLNYLFGLLLGDSSTQTADGNGTVNNVSILDGLLLSDDRSANRNLVSPDGLLLGDEAVFQRIMMRLIGLFLDEVVGTTTQTGDGVVNTVSIVDGLLLGDEVIKTRLLVALVHMLLGDTASAGAEKALALIDGLYFTDGVSKSLELALADALYVEDLHFRLRSILWDEGLYLSDSAERTVVGVLVAHLVYGRLAINSFLEMKPRVIDFLSMKHQVTQWRFD